jgi:hypothetical protein
MNVKMKKLVAGATIAAVLGVTATGTDAGVANAAPAHPPAWQSRVNPWRMAIEACVRVTVQRDGVSGGRRRAADAGRSTSESHNVVAAEAIPLA